MKQKSTNESGLSWILLDDDSVRSEHGVRQIRKEIAMEGIHVEAEIPLTNPDIIRSWKDPRYRRTLSTQQLQTLPEHPAGPALLTDQEIKVAGGLMLEEEDISIPLTTALGCTEWTFHNWKSCGC